MTRRSAWSLAVATLLAAASGSAAGAGYSVVKELAIGGSGGWD